MFIGSVERDQWPEMGHNNKLVAITPTNISNEKASDRLNINCLSLLRVSNELIIMCVQ